VAAPPGCHSACKIDERIASSENVTRWRHWNRQSDIRGTRRFRSAFDETGCGRVRPSIARAGHSPRRWSSGRGGTQLAPLATRSFAGQSCLDLIEDQIEAVLTVLLG
jgi:hypothetical protein